jgi:hypothetical protein
MMAGIFAMDRIIVVIIAVVVLFCSSQLPKLAKNIGSAGAGVFGGPTKRLTGRSCPSRRNRQPPNLGVRVVAVGRPIGPRDRPFLKIHKIVLSKFVGAEGLEPPASAV